MSTSSSTQEIRDLLSSLPKGEGILEPYSYQYQGFWYSPIGMQGIIECQQHFQARENDTFLVTSPKSGATWFKAILFALINREACHPQDPHHPLLKKIPHQLVPFLELIKPSDYDLVSNSSNRIFACHISTVSLPTSIMEEGRIVYLCRDIKDTFVSLFHFSNKANFDPRPFLWKMPLICSAKESLSVDLFGIKSWDTGRKARKGHWPHKVLFMRYEEMMEEPHLQLRRLAHFLGKPFSQEEEKSGLLDQIIKLCSFDSMSKLEVDKTGNMVGEISNDLFFRSGVVGDWKNYLTAEMASKLDQITEKKFCDSGLFLT